MRALSKYQSKTLKLFREGKTLSEICGITRYPEKRVKDSLRRAEQNVQKAIEIIQFVSENGGLADKETVKLKEILSKC